MAELATTATIVAIFLIVLSVSLPAALADAGFIARTCENTGNAQCVEVLSADPRSANATTVRDLAGIALDIATANARDSSKTIEGEADKNDGTPLGEALVECGTIYDQAVFGLEDAHGDFDSGSYGDAKAQTSAAEDAADNCEKAFSDRQLTSTVADVDKRMKDRCGVASDVIDLLWVPSHRFLRV